MYPSHHLTNGHPVHSVILVNAKLDTNKWAPISIPNSSDLSAVQVRGESGNLTIYNIYNDCQHDATLEALDAHLRAHHGARSQGMASHMLWCGDFNRLHPLWDEDWNRHLFTTAALQAADCWRKLLTMTCS